MQHLQKKSKKQKRDVILNLKNNGTTHPTHSQLNFDSWTATPFQWLQQPYTTYNRLRNTFHIGLERGR